MKGPSTLLFVALALAALLILEPTANAVVHRLSPTLTRRPLKSSPTATKTSNKNAMRPLDRLESIHGFDWTMAREQRRLQQQQQKASDDSCTGSSGDAERNDGSRVSLDLDRGYNFELVAEVNIGSPSQGPFEMELDFGAQQPYVLKKGAKYRDDGKKVKNALEYNKKASNTSVQQNAAFTYFYVYQTGSVVSDTLQIGPLSVNQSIQVTKQVDSDFDYYGDYGIDGTLGLGVSDARDGSSFVEQLASQLDSPVLTVYVNRQFDKESQGVLSFGDRVPEMCDAASWQKMSSWVSQWVSYPAVDTVSVTGPAASNGCGGQVTANITVGFANTYRWTKVSVQVQQLFVQASGARWDYDYGWVVDDASKAVSVKFHTASGDVIEVTPADYLLNWGDTVYLTTYGTYDQAIYAEEDYIVLGQNFLNNHCLSMNMQRGEWSLANALSPSVSSYDGSVETSYDASAGTSGPFSASSSSSSSSLEGTDYITRKH